MVSVNKGRINVEQDVTTSTVVMCHKANCDSPWTLLQFLTEVAKMNGDAKNKIIQQNSTKLFVEW